MVSGEINALNNIVVNILFNILLKQRELITNEQRWDERKTVRTASDENSIGTEHLRSDEWNDKGGVAGAKLMPYLVKFRRDTIGQWRKIVVDVKVTTSEDMNKAFREKPMNQLYRLDQFTNESHFPYECAFSEKMSDFLRKC